MVHKGNNEQVFCSLHHHSTYSYLDGFGTPEQHVRAAADIGISTLALTEHGNVTSHVRLEQAAVAAGIKPVFGCELYTGSVGEEGSRYKWHLTVLAKDQKGLRNLNAVVSAGWENFYYEPTVDGETLSAYSEGLLVLSGCSGSKMACDLLGGKGREPHLPDVEAATRTALQFREVLGDNFYLECQAFPTLERTCLINQAWEEISNKTGIPLVATGDVHYPKPEDSEMQVLLHAIGRGGRNNTFEKQQQSWGYDIKLTNFTDRVLWKRLVQTGLSPSAAETAIRNSRVIADRIEAVIPKLQELRFPGELPAGQLVRAQMNEGWKARRLEGYPEAERKRYKERAFYELELIETKGFLDYFLVVGDMVRWAKNQGIAVGPARGSAAASLVCWLLRITEVNPMLFPNLLFERFIDINRHDLPDIDLDFDDERRWEVRAYLVDKYGADRVGNIGTFTKFKGKNSLTDVAKVHRIPYGAVETVKEMLIERASGDLRGDATLEDTAAMFPKVQEQFDKYPRLLMSQRLEGNLRGFSVHAAGLVVANEPLTHSCAVYTRYDDKTGEVVGNVLSIDKYDAEYINALKIDALGLTTMGMIGRCLKRIGMTLDELYSLPLNEEFVFEGFRRNEVVGIFQFDGRAMRSVNREVKPDNFAEICDINALARPGPLHSGAAAEYIMVKHGKKKAEHLHPVVDLITAHTHGQIVYQEQILQTVRQLGGFSWEEAARIRKLISKKQGEQAFNAMLQRFLEGTKANGVKEIVALKIWKQLVTAGAYAFNAAHCVSYGMLAYWTMWLKQKHPLEFYEAALQKYKDKEKLFDVMKEATARGIPILPPHPQASLSSWTIEGDGLRAGLLQVDGIGEKTEGAMIEFREQWFKEAAARGAYQEMETFGWGDFAAVRGVGPVTIEKIESFAAQQDPFGLNLLSETIARVRAWLWKHGEEMGVPFPKHVSEDVPYEAKRGEYVWLGVVRDRNLKDLYELHRSRTGEELDPKTVREPQHINWLVVTGEDHTGPLVITFPRYNGFYDKIKDRLWDMNIKRYLLLVRGYKRTEYRRAIYASEVHIIKPEELGL